MEEEVIDSKHKPKINGKFNWTIWIGSALTAFGLFKCQQSGILLENSVLLTLCLFILSIAGNIFNPKVGVVITTLIFVLGIFSVCHLFPTQHSFGIGIGDLTISFEIYSLLFLFIHFALTIKSHEQFISLGAKNKS